MCSTKLFWLLLPLISLAVWGRICPPSELPSSNEISLTVVCYPNHYALLTWDNGNFPAENVRVHSSCRSSNSTTQVQQEIIDSIDEDDFASSVTVPAEQWDECSFEGCYVRSGSGFFFKFKEVTCSWPVSVFDECSYGTHNCSINANCTDTSDSFNCTCHDGYEGDGSTCTNINECMRNLSNCDINAKCSDTNGSFLCNCTNGYFGNGHNCSNIDECTLATDTCHHHATCTDTLGKFNCICEPGFEGDGFNCTNIDECVTDSHNCHQNAICSDIVGGFSCNCTEGYEGDGVSCANINECNESPCHPNSTCTDTNGSYECHCDIGYTSDGKACTNIDECEADHHNCSLNATCTDTKGSYNCTCNIGFEGDGYVCVELSDDYTTVIGLTAGLTVVALILVTVVVVILVVCVLRHQRHDDVWFLGSSEKWEAELVSIAPPTYLSMTSLVSVFDTLNLETAKGAATDSKPETLISENSELENSHEYEGCSSEHEYVAVDGESSRNTFCVTVLTGRVQPLDHTLHCSRTNSEPNNDIMSEGKRGRMSNSNECHQSTQNERVQREIDTMAAFNEEKEKKQISSTSSLSSTNESIVDGKYVIFVDMQCH